jgi:aryl-alcohol dehydrogenase-like predicted oxidoreductase
VQSEYSLWTRDFEADAIGAMGELGVGFVPYSPLGRGFLTATVDVSALGWVYAQQERLGVPLAPIPGTKRIKWLEQNIAALDVTLTADELAILDPLASQVTGARY